LRKVDDVDEDDAMDVARNGRDVEQVGEVVRELVVLPPP